MIAIKCAASLDFRAVAGVVKLVDTPDLGSGGGNAVGVQVPSPAPLFSIVIVSVAIRQLCAKMYKI